MVDCSIKTERLTKVYNGIKAVDSLDLTINAGEICGFLGPNGAGKTTTIGMMIGLIEPTGGKCYVNDIEVTGNPLGVKQIIGYLPESVGFYSNLTGQENLRYLAGFYGLKGHDTDKKIAELIDYVGLGKIDKAVGGYSRGMKQRLGLAKALLNDPGIIFLDEPTNGLDPEGVVQFRNIIKEQSSRGKTIFFSSHILDEVQHICNTMCIISKGKLIAHGSMDEVKKIICKDKNTKIFVKVKGAMPELHHPEIVDISQDKDGVIIKAKSDISDYISDHLFEMGVQIKELRVMEESLEDLFLDTVYRGD